MTAADLTREIAEPQTGPHRIEGRRAIDAQHYLTGWGSANGALIAVETLIVQTWTKLERIERLSAPACSPK
jgi:hypothetical protein